MNNLMKNLERARKNMQYSIVVNSCSPFIYVPLLHFHSFARFYRISLLLRMIPGICLRYSHTHTRKYRIAIFSLLLVRVNLKGKRFSWITSFSIAFSWFTLNAFCLPVCIAVLVLVTELRERHFTQDIFLRLVRCAILISLSNLLFTPKHPLVPLGPFIWYFIFNYYQYEEWKFRAYKLHQSHQSITESVYAWVRVLCVPNRPLASVYIPQ